MTSSPYKLDHWVDGEWLEYSHPPVFSVRGDPSNGRVIATAPGSDPIVFETLAALLSPPFFLLYVLHSPRGEAEPGRYQSEEIDRVELAGFLRRFDDLLRRDGRFNLWLHSRTDDATIVWDQHDLVYAYGAESPYVAALRGLGFEQGEPAIPAPHAHHYHAEFDGDSLALLASRDWYRSPLRPEDDP